MLLAENKPAGGTVLMVETPGTDDETCTRIHMRVEFKSIQPRETQVRLDSGCNDLDHVETFNVSAEAQATIDREYIKFLEAKNASLKCLCAEARRLLQSAN